MDFSGALTSRLEMSASSSEPDSESLAEGRTAAIALGSSSEEGAVAATVFGAVLVEVVAVDCFPFLAASASARVKVLYPLPGGKPVGQSHER